MVHYKLPARQAIKAELFTLKGSLIILRQKGGLKSLATAGKRKLSVFRCDILYFRVENNVFRTSLKIAFKKTLWHCHFSINFNLASKKFLCLVLENQTSLQAAK